MDNRGGYNLPGFLLNIRSQTDSYQRIRKGTQHGRTVRLRHPQTGIVKTGLYGFSWTTLFFSGIPALCRGDLVTGVIVLLLSASSFWIAAVIWAFVYNRVYTTRLLESGYIFDDSPNRVAEAKRKLRIQD